MSVQTDVLVHARGLTKRFGGLTAVDGVDFDVHVGEAFGFLGPNGAGKTTTMRMISCACPVTEGTLTVIGMDPGREATQIKARLGVVPQIDNLDAELTVLENLLMYARYFDIPRSVARRRADELLEFMQLTERASDQVEPLSGGMKRRLTIARALINEPDLLILDEPTTGLDPQARHLLWERLYRLKQRGVTLIITTHYMDEAEQLCDRLVVMDKAEIVAEGTPRELIEQYATREVLELRIPEETAPGSTAASTTSPSGSRSCRIGSCSTPPTASRRSSRFTPARFRSSPPSSAAPRWRTSSCGSPAAPWWNDATDEAGSMTALRVTQRNLFVYRRTWRGSVFGSFLTPLLYLSAMGMGLGSLIAAQDTSALGGVDYLHFLGPGLLAAPACRPPASKRPTRSWARSAGGGTTRRSWPPRCRSATCSSASWAGWPSG